MANGRVRSRLLVAKKIVKSKQGLKSLRTAYACGFYGIPRAYIPKGQAPQDTLGVVSLSNNQSLLMTTQHKTIGLLKWTLAISLEIYVRGLIGMNFTFQIS